MFQPVSDTCTIAEGSKVNWPGSENTQVQHTCTIAEGSKVNWPGSENTQVHLYHSRGVKGQLAGVREYTGTAHLYQYTIIQVQYTCTIAEGSKVNLPGFIRVEHNPIVIFDYKVGCFCRCELMYST